MPAALPRGDAVRFAGCAVSPPSALRQAVPPSCVPSVEDPSPVPPHPPLAFLDKNLFQYWLFLIVASTSETQQGDWSLGIFLLFLPGVGLAMRLVGYTPHPAQGTRPTDGPFVPGTELPPTCCTLRPIVCNKLHWKQMGAPSVPTLTCPGRAKPQSTPPQLQWGESTGTGQRAKRWGGKRRCTRTWGAGWPAPVARDRGWQAPAGCGYAPPCIITRISKATVTIVSALSFKNRSTTSKEAL